jgi:hypothetical protein
MFPASVLTVALADRVNQPALQCGSPGGSVVPPRAGSQRPATAESSLIGDPAGVLPGDALIASRRDEAPGSFAISVSCQAIEFEPIPASEATLLIREFHFGEGEPR